MQRASTEHLLPCHVDNINGSRMHSIRDDGREIDKTGERSARKTTSPLWGPKDGVRPVAHAKGERSEPVGVKQPSWETGKRLLCADLPQGEKKTMSQEDELLERNRNNHRNNTGSDD